MKLIRTLFRTLGKGESGQDLAEYCLITALIALAACGVFVQMSGGMQVLWTTANTTLATNPQPARPAGSGDVPSSPSSAPVR